MSPSKAQGTEAWRQAFDDEQIDLSELRPVEVSRGRPKSSLAVRFDTKDLDRLRARAESDGVGVTQLVRRWVLERLDQPEDEGEMDSLLEALDQSLKVARALQRTRKRRGS
jgi:hypothetical protein